MFATDSKKLIERAAYHEAGHVVVAARKALEIKRSGMWIDDRGKGHSGMRLRFPGIQGDYPISREDSIVVLYAGLIAEQHFDPQAGETSASCDFDWIEKLRTEVTPSIATAELKDVSHGLVEQNWSAISRLATIQLGIAFQAWRAGEISEWSESTIAANLDGDEIASALVKFDIVVRLAGAGRAL